MPPLASQGAQTGTTKIPKGGQKRDQNRFFAPSVQDLNSGGHFKGAAVHRQLRSGGGFSFGGILEGITAECSSLNTPTQAFGLARRIEQASLFTAAPAGGE